MIYAITVYCYLGPKLGLVVRKLLALLGVESSEVRWSSSSKSIFEVKGYSDWKCNGFLSLVRKEENNPLFTKCGVRDPEHAMLVNWLPAFLSLWPHHSSI